MGTSVHVAIVSSYQSAWGNLLDFIGVETVIVKEKFVYDSTLPSLILRYSQLSQLLLNDNIPVLLLRVPIHFSNVGIYYTQKEIFVC